MHVTPRGEGRESPRARARVPNVVPPVTKLLQSLRYGYCGRANPGIPAAIPSRSRMCRVAPPRHAFFPAQTAPARPAQADSPLGPSLSVSASASFERGSVVLTYLDFVLVLVVAIPALALGAPEL